MIYLRLVLFLALTLAVLAVFAFLRARAVVLDDTVWHDYPLGRSYP